MEEVPLSVLEGRVKPCKGNVTSINLVPRRAWRTGSQMAFRRLQKARPGLKMVVGGSKLQGGRPVRGPGMIWNGKQGC